MQQDRQLRVEEPRVPSPARSLVKAQDEQQSYRAQLYKLSGRSAVRGLLVLALIVLLASIARAGLGRVFVAGWWRP